MNTLVKAERLRGMHGEGEMLVLPNAWDAVSAKVFERAGFGAVATTSGGIAGVLGYADGEKAPGELMLMMAGRIAASVEAPVTADLEAGYAPAGEAAEGVAKTVARAIELGIVGMNLEDGRKGKGLVAMEEQVEVIRAAREAGRRMGVPVVINARVDVFLRGMPSTEEMVAETVRRGNAYLEAGADCVFPILVKDRGAIGELVRGIRGPVNVMVAPGVPPLAELRELGVRRVSFGSGLMRMGLPELRERAEMLRARGECEGLGQTEFTAAVVNGMFGG